MEESEAKSPGDFILIKYLSFLRIPKGLTIYISCPSTSPQKVGLCAVKGMRNKSRGKLFNSDHHLHYALAFLQHSILVNVILLSLDRRARGVFLQMVFPHIFLSLLAFLLGFLFWVVNFPSHIESFLFESVRIRFRKKYYEEKENLPQNTKQGAQNQSFLFKVFTG